MQYKQCTSNSLPTVQLLSNKYINKIHKGTFVKLKMVTPGVFNVMW